MVVTLGTAQRDTQKCQPGDLRYVVQHVLPLLDEVGSGRFLRVEPQEARRDERLGIARLQLIAGFRLRTVDLKAGHYRISDCYGWIQIGERRSLNCAD